MLFPFARHRRLEQGQCFCGTGVNAGRRSLDGVGAEIALKGDEAEGTALRIAMGYFGHHNSPEGAGTGALAAAPAGIFIDDDSPFAQEYAVERTGTHALWIRTLLTLYGLGNIIRMDNVNARREIIAVRSHGKNTLSRMTDDAGGHAGFAADAQLRVDFNMLIHG